MKTDIKSFDYKTLAKKYHIAPDKIKKITKEIYKEFPNDDMLAELHIVRAVKEYKRQTNKKEGGN